MIGRRILFPGALVLLLIGASVSGADDSAPTRVGGISVAEGEVAIRLPTGDRAAGAWSEAGRNDPVASGMSLRTGAGARAAVRVGADLIALSGGSEADILKLDEAATVLALRRGRIGVLLSAHGAGGAAEIVLPSGALRLSAPGEYDIVAGDGKSEAKSIGRLAVLAGEARISGNGIDTVVAGGGAALLTGNDPVTMLPGSAEADEFVGWWGAQKRNSADSPVLRHVSAQVTGHQMLDEHGVWESVAGFGAVWFPRDLPGGWAPFRYGRWRWIGPWGWTWIDDMPWGFATSHYGRWAQLDAGGSDSDGGRWGWVPGKRVDDPIFMPAAVAFLGTAGVGLSYPDAFSPAVAWFPLAPGEVYWPSFTDDPDTIRRLNKGAVADAAAIGPAAIGPMAIGSARKDDPPAEIVTGQYRNRRHASVVPRPVFVGGKPVAEAMIELPARRLENAPLLAGSPGIEPATAGPPVRTAATAAGSGGAATLTRARDTLARIVKLRGKKPSLEAAVSRIPVPKMLAIEQRSPKPRGVNRNEKGRIERATVRARSAAVSKPQLPKAERIGKPAKSHAAKSQAAGLRRADTGGG